MTAATSQCVAPQDRAALAAGFPAAPVHPGLAAVVAIGAGEVAEIAEGGAASANAEFQHLHQGLAQLLEPRRADAPRWGVGADASHEQAFIGIDVANPGHQCLIEQRELGQDMKAETLAFFEEVIWKQNRPLAELLNANVTFATPRLAKHYGLVPVKGDGLARYDLSGVPERGGLLTQGSVLTIGGDEASMVTRGLFVLHDLLRSGVKDPPPCVDTTPVATKPGLTQRSIAEDRVANKSCGGCHGKFDRPPYRP